MHPVDDNNTDLIDEADRVASLIVTARRMLDDDKMVDLSALERRVAGLCQSIESQTVVDKKTLRTSLKIILADLDRLTVDLTHQNAAVRQANGDGDPKRAARAYENDDR